MWSTAIPIIQDGGTALFGSRPEGTSIIAGNPQSEPLRKRIVAGRMFDTPDEKGVLVSEFLLYRMGVMNDFDLDQIVGKRLRVEIQSRRIEPGFNVSIIKRPSKAPRTDNRDEQLAIDQLAAQLPEALEKLELTPPEIELLRKATEHAPSPEPQVFTEEFSHPRGLPPGEGGGAERLWHSLPAHLGLGHALPDRERVLFPRSRPPRVGRRPGGPAGGQRAERQGRCQARR